jgi:PKHD-type hydroxylase
MVVADVLGPTDLARICEGLARAPFLDGRATAGAAARRVKDNEQAGGDDLLVGELACSVRSALERHPIFQGLVRPSRWSKFMFSRYAAGHRYGLHTDDAAMSDEHGWSLRTDISFTLFLSEPDAYEGGALRLVSADGERSFRPAAGSAVVYPTGVLHEVTPVTSGVRLACIGWVQSRLRRSDQREILSDLDRVRRELPEGGSQLLLDKTIGNLLRMWDES